VLALLKYPRTQHIQGSRTQPGDEDLDSVPYEQLAGRQLVVEEKLDGANSALSFDQDGQLWLQSRGHFLLGGHRERHFALLKTWAHSHQAALWQLLGSRYVLYGEWLYAKHTVFYDALPHYFLEFDVWDREQELFLDTDSRHRMLAHSPVCSVPVLSSGPAPAQNQLSAWVRRSVFKTAGHRAELRAAALELGLNPERIEQETDSSDLSEGLYLKVEEGGAVRARYKFVRASFLTAVLESETHWLDRPIVRNRLAPGVDLFAC
jgi:hypothetical protein